MKSLLKLVAPLALIAMPASLLAQDAQDEVLSGDELAGVMGALGEKFPVEPLTPEEEARLPAATALVDKIIPDGTMGEMMSGMFDGFLGPLMELDESGGQLQLAKLLGISASQLENIDDDAVEHAAAMLDPDWELRREREAEAMPRAMNAMMAAMEPTMKSAMSEMYAVYFDATELSDIDAFFSTESGANYARKSFSMSADPRFAGAMMQAMPAIFAGMADMQAELDAATADLAEQRSWDDLEPAEQEKLASMLRMNRFELDAMVSGLEAEEAREY